MITIAPSQRMNLADLFANHIGLRSALDAMLQGHYGEARADSAAEPKVAALAVGPFTFLGGDSAHPVADQLVGQFTDFRVISVANSDWHEKITMWQNSETSIEKRYAFSSERLDRAHLQLLAANVPDGFEIRALDLELAERLCTDVHKNLIPDLFWDSPADFIARGFGFCALSEGRIEAGVTSALLSDEAAGTQINTNPDCQGKGVATALGATFLLNCLDRGLMPHWDTGSPISYRVAEKLGYQLIGPYEVLEWEPADRV